MENLKDIDLGAISSLDIKIPHRNWKNALAEAFALASTAQPGEVISIIGPTRAGKSSLIRELFKALCGSPSSFEVGTLPFVIVDLVNDDKQASFSTKAFLHQALELVDHPIYSIKNYEWDDERRLQRIERATEKTLNRALIRGLVNRKTRFLVIDEAQHIKYAGRNTMAAQGVMDALKCIALKAGVVLVLSGTYAMLPAIQGSSHLVARTHKVHLPRYYNVEEDLPEFGWILSHYDKLLTLDKSLPSILDCAELLYYGSFGCIGQVRAWLYHSSVKAATVGTGITEAIILDALKTEEELKSIAIEIEEGERLLGCEQQESLKLAGEVALSKKRKARPKPFQRKNIRYKPSNRI